MSDSSIQFFGAVDRKNNDKTGDIVNSYPAWYYTNKMQELGEDVSNLRMRIEAAEETGGFMADKIPVMKKELRAKEFQLDQIAISKPKLSDKDKDAMAELYQRLGERIAESMPTYTDMQRGTTSAHREANMMSTPCIDVPHKTVMHLQAMGIDAKRGGKISRNQAQKAWKIAGRLLETNTNAEVLRKDKKTGTYEIHRDLVEMSRD